MKSVGIGGNSIGVFRLCHPIHTISPTEYRPEYYQIVFILGSEPADSGGADLLS